MDTRSCRAITPQPAQYPGRICMHPHCDNVLKPNAKREICEDCRQLKNCEVKEK
jgi:hypothetical protein